jgi:hypothetical protein
MDLSVWLLRQQRSRRSGISCTGRSLANPKLEGDYCYSKEAQLSAALCSCRLHLMFQVCIESLDRRANTAAAAKFPWMARSVSPVEEPMKRRLPHCLQP